MIRGWCASTNSVDGPTPTREPIAPFLSVLVRTQGRRPEALADVLLCLSAQTCSDIEVLLLAHDVGAEERTRLDQQVAGLRADLRGRVRLVTVEGGGRTRPLTVGMALATGHYLAVLDDDDLVLGHWVEAFRTAAVASPGRIVRSVAVEQDMEPVAGDAGHRAASWPHARWDSEFSMLSHLVDNHSPVHCYAYPREVFSGSGLRFDEQLAGAGGLGPLGPCRRSGGRARHGRGDRGLSPVAGNTVVFLRGG